MPKQKFLWGGLLIICVLFFACSCTQKAVPNQAENKDTTQEEIKLKIGYDVESVYDAPVVVGIEKGFFEEQNLNITPVALTSGSEVKVALASGQIDIGIASFAHFLNIIAKGAPIKVIAPSFMTPSNDYLFVKPNSGIETFDDLIGKKIGTHQGSGANFSLMYTLSQKMNNDLINEIEFIDIDDSMRPIALMEKNAIDAAIGSKNDITIYEKAGAVMHKEWQLQENTNKLLLKGVIATNIDLLSTRADILQKFIKAYIDSKKFIYLHPNEAAGIMSQNINKMSNGAIDLSANDIINSWELMKPVVWCEPSSFTDMASISFQIGDIDNLLTLDEIFDLRFEGKLKQAQIEIYGEEN